MTSRLLLTLLALLTGLAAQAGPAEARIHAARSAEMSAVAARDGEVRTSIPAILMRNRISAGPGRLPVGRQMLPQAAVAPVPTVLAGIDRARE